MQLKKSECIKMAKDTLAILQNGAYTNAKGAEVALAEWQKAAEKSTKVYTPDWLNGLIDSANIIPVAENNTYAVVQVSALEAAEQLHRQHQAVPMVLNAASAKHPGGGTLNGANSPEEMLCRATGLYPCLLRAQVFYNTHRRVKTVLYSDHLAYSAKIPVFKHDDGSLRDEPFSISVISAAPVNFAAIEQQERESKPVVQEVMEERIRKILYLAVFFQHEYLVIGPWGCGALKNSPGDVAGMFFRALEGEFRGMFKKVVFAIQSKDDRVLPAFVKRFAPREG